MVARIQTHGSADLMNRNVNIADAESCVDLLNAGSAELAQNPVPFLAMLDAKNADRSGH